MPSAPIPSNIRADVRWREPSVYAGEEIECIITFRNIARTPSQESNVEEQTNGWPRETRPLPAPSVAAQSRRSSILQGKPMPKRTTSLASTATSAQPGKGHRPTLSLNVVTGPSKAGLQSAPIQTKASNSAVKPARRHGRSLSILSMGSDGPSDGRGPTSAPLPKRPFNLHGRSASVQLAPKTTPNATPMTGYISPRQPSPLQESITPPTSTDNAGEALPLKPARRRPGTVSAGNTPQLGRQNSLRRSPGSGTLNTNFSFPAAPQQPPLKSPTPQPEPQRRSPANMHSGQNRASSPRPHDSWSGPISNLNPISRVMSETSTAGTPRSSSEFYSMSNHSDETLTSEIPSQANQYGRLGQKSAPHSRQASGARPVTRIRAAEPETLMMGYAQTMGYFVLDGSLVNAAPFEEVKRKGVQSGGGVVGMEKAKRNSGMFGAFSWGAIGESLGGLLGGDEMSSMAQMKANAGSKSIPLLSTPQNLLFVDLRLAPGESRSYNYRFTLPRGLPPSHRGRAIKVFYYMALGVQRPEGQAVKHVDIPFRVLGSYNMRGETLGHDLMAPYILLQDSAKSTSMTSDPSSPSPFPQFIPKAVDNKAKLPKQGLEDFLRYTERLLDKPQGIHGTLASPTSPTSTRMSRKESTTEQQASSIKDAVDFAILRANHVQGNGKQQRTDGTSANRFNIARGGHPVAVLTLLRPAYRLGEIVIGTIDFTVSPSRTERPAPSPTYSVVADLESVERIDSSLAIRSSNSINRVTRKVYASSRDNTLFGRQISFRLAIPPGATPTFDTTGVSLLWRLRVEFTTERQGIGIEGVSEDSGDNLLEEIASDERGATLIAKEKLPAETFEIEVPLKVFGVPDIEAMSTVSETLVI